MRKSQTERIIAELSAGRWVPVETFMGMHIPDYRSRICELKKRGYRLESRMVHRRPGYRSKDWRDLDAVDALRDSVRASVAAAQTYGFANRTRVTLDTPAGGVTVMCGRLRLLTVDAMTDEILRGLGND